MGEIFRFSTQTLPLVAVRCAVPVTFRLLRCLKLSIVTLAMEKVCMKCSLACLGVHLFWKNFFIKGRNIKTIKKLLGSIKASNKVCTSWRDNSTKLENENANENKDTGGLYAGGSTCSLAVHS